MEKQIGSILVSVVQGDISELAADAIVNAANSDLWMGSGVAGAIKQRGGEEIEREAMAQGPISPGQAVITNAGSLRAKKVIHCAGMPPGGRATYEYVENSAKAALELAQENKLSSIAFPAVGAGVGGLSIKDSIYAILEAIKSYSEKNKVIKTVFLVGYSSTSYEEVRTALEEWEE